MHSYTFYECFFILKCLTKNSTTMLEILQKAKDQLQSGDIKTIAERNNIPYQTLYKVLQGAKSKRQTEILKAVTDFLEERKTELVRLERVLN